METQCSQACVILCPVGQPTMAEPLLCAGHRARLGKQVKHGPGPPDLNLGEVADAWMHWDPPDTHRSTPDNQHIRSDRGFLPEEVSVKVKISRTL